MGRIILLLVRGLGLDLRYDGLINVPVNEIYKLLGMGICGQ
jgi:hypothetical protein